MQYMLLLLLLYEIPTSFVKNFPFRTGVKFDRLNWGYVQKIICSYFNFKERSKKAIHVKYPICNSDLVNFYTFLLKIALLNCFYNKQISIQPSIFFYIAQIGPSLKKKILILR